MKNSRCKNLTLAILMYICGPHAELLWQKDNKENTHDLEHQYSWWANIFI